MLPQIGFSEESEKLVLSVKENAWLSHMKTSSYEVFEFQKNGEAQFLLKKTFDGGDLEEIPLSEIEFKDFKNHLAGILSENQMGREIASLDCEKTSYSIDWPVAGKKSSICAYDHGSYFRVRGVLMGVLGH